MTIREYAAINNITYEAARQQVKRYADDLEGHITVVNRAQDLDEYAVQFLDARRKASPVVVLDTRKNDEIALLQEENKKLLLKLSEKQDKIELLQDRLEKLREQQIEAAKAPALLEASQKELEEVKRRADATQKELSQVTSQLREREQEIAALRQEKETTGEKKQHGWLWKLFFNEPSEQ